MVAVEDISRTTHVFIMADKVYLKFFSMILELPMSRGHRR